MNTDSCTRRFTPPRKISRLRFYFRIFFIAAVLIVLAAWLDYWLRIELGIAKAFSDFVAGRWGTGVLMGGGILYVLLLSVPFVPGVELGVLSQNRLPSFLSKYRYLTIALLFNLPGNYLIGGGGGISLACGISRRFSWKWFLLTVVLAVSPVPLLAFLGVIQLQAFLGIPK